MVAAKWAVYLYGYMIFCGATKEVRMILHEKELTQGCAMFTITDGVYNPTRAMFFRRQLSCWIWNKPVPVRAPAI